MAINMFGILSFISVLLTHVANAAPAANAACLYPIHIIAARGSNQAPGTGSIGAVADQMKLYAPTAHVHAVRYPATMENPAYMDSLKTGSLNLQQMIRRIVDRCPNAKIALLGYSQGANVVGDALVGSTENQNGVAPLDAKYAPNIKAVVLTGDPAHEYRQQFTVGTGRNNGDTPRTVGHAMHPYSDRIVSYCEANDPVCDSPGGLDWNVHWSYMAKYKVDAAYFALSKLWEL